MCTFRQNFLVHLQLGATRKTLVKGWICAALVIDALLVLINLIILSIFLLIGLPVASTLFNWGLDPIPLRLFANSVQMYCANLLLMSIGYLLTCGFYRLNKIGKWIVSILMGGAVFLFGNFAIRYEACLMRRWMPSSPSLTPTPSSPADSICWRRHPHGTVLAYYPGHSRKKQLRFLNKNKL